MPMANCWIEWLGMVERRKTLVLGYGNPARGDDGLGPAMIALLDRAAFDRLETRVDYQLCVEDARDIGSFEHVIFVDASPSIAPPYHLYPLEDSAQPMTLDTHSVSPEAMMFLARTLFGATTAASVLAIRGYDFEPFVESLSSAAEANLEQAFLHLARKYEFSDIHS